MVCCEGEGNSFYIKIRFSDEDAVSSDIINRFFVSGLVALPRFGSNYSISQLVSLSLSLSILSYIHIFTVFKLYDFTSCGKEDIQ